MVLISIPKVILILFLIFITLLDNNEVIYNFDSLRAASKYLNISRPSLVEYSKSERLWNDKCKFKIYK